MRIGVDVMGGDNAPDEILKGALQALPRLADDDTLVLLGDRGAIEDTLSERGIKDPRIECVFTSQVIGMDESPVDGIRNKEDSSITVMSKMGAPGHAHRLDAILSAGNTGACVAGAQMYLRRLPGVIRPGIACTIPTFAGPAHLAQYGVMGDVYAHDILGIKQPRVALMNVGGEANKGTADAKEARELLENTPNINFIGFVEGRGVFDGEADVVITNGVVGNVMIKLAEGLSAGIFRALATEVLEIDPSLAARLDPVVKSLYAKYDYHEYGGAPLLGVNGTCLISHGSSQARTIMNAVLRCKQFVTAGINDTLVKRLATCTAAQA